jgi:hydrogenase/urease accessory protein HupE
MDHPRSGVVRFASAAALTLPTAAWAHGEIKGIGAFYSGVLHPFISPAHLIALLALGLLFGQRGVPSSRGALAALTGALALGLAFSARMTGLPEPDLPLLVLAMLLGLAVVVARPWPAVVIGVMSALTGLCVGLGSAPDGMAAAQRWNALVGTFIGASLCTACVAGLVHGAQQPWARIGVRVVGSWLTASAILVLTLAVARA